MTNGFMFRRRAYRSIGMPLAAATALLLAEGCGPAQESAEPAPEQSAQGLLGSPQLAAGLQRASEHLLSLRSRLGLTAEHGFVARSAVALHAKQTDAGMRNLDFSAFVRWNTDDHSALTWIELRRRYTGFDVAAQWLRYSGERGTVFGSTPYRTSLQLLATAYF